jgi:hypothetical protein
VELSMERIRKKRDKHCREDGGNCEVLRRILPVTNTRFSSTVVEARLLHLAADITGTSLTQGAAAT